LQCYTKRKENAYLKDGHLVIHSIPEQYDGHSYTSARLHLRRDGWTYGKFEAKAKLPKGKHLWPAIWLFPQDSVFGTWAASGEIDIMEYRGQRTNQIQGTIHYGGYWPHNTWHGSGEKNFTTDFSADFHIFEFEWDQNEMKWFCDGKQFHNESLNKSFWSKNGPNPYQKNGEPFNQNFVWILNMAIGGGFFPAATYGNLDVNEAKQWPKPTMEIDYVRVYQKPDQIHGTQRPDTTLTTEPVITEGKTDKSESTTHSTTISVEKTTASQSLLDANGCCPSYTGKVCNFDSKHNCVKDEKGLIMLCGLNAGACNGQCFGLDLYYCLNGKLEHKP
jgi:beta-glucanase (GH16 family)